MIDKKTTLMKRRKLAIIVSIVAVVALVFALVWVLDYVKTTTVTDVDGTEYYIRYRDKEYALYDTDKKTKLPTDDEYGYYVTHADTLVEVDAETGEYEIIAVVDTEGNEQVGFNQRLLMFPHIEKANIRKLEVHNEEGSFTFVRMNTDTGKQDDDSDFVIKQSPLVSYDQEMFASLYVSAGYTLTTMKIEDPIKDENGEFSEYGLVPISGRVRNVVDETTGEPVTDKETGEYVVEEYDYVPAYYILTDKSGNEYKVIIGDALVTGGGYYVQYVDMSGGEEVKRDAVYVLSSDFGDTMLAAIEDFVTPQLTYPMSMNDYFDVEDFFVFNKKADYTPDKEITDVYEAVVGFSYIPLSERENTIKSSEPYVFSGYSLNGYTPSSDNINSCLQSIYEPSLVKCYKLSPTGKDMYDCGLAVEVTDDEGNTTYELAPEHLISFKYDITDDDGNVTETILQYVYVSRDPEDPNGSFFAYTEVYSVDGKGNSDKLLYTLDMIVEVQAHTFEFLSWDAYDWINSGYINLNIAFCEKITLSSPNYNATFELDNSASNTTESTSSTNLKINAYDSNGNSLSTFSVLEVYDESGNRWVISATEIKCYGSTGSELKIKTAYYDYNAMGTQTRVVSGYIQCKNGDKVYVSADEVRVDSLDDSKDVTYVRYDTNLFRQFYKTLLYASISNKYLMTEAEETELIGDSGKWLLTMTILNSEGEETTYSFYRLTSRKAYITINGNGGFYVLSNRVDKFISDAQKFFANEMIDATAKN